MGLGGGGLRHSPAKYTTDWTCFVCQFNAHLIALRPLFCFVQRIYIYVPVGSPSRGGNVGNVAVYVFDINQPSLATPFYSVLVSISVLMALSAEFHSINSPDNSPLSPSVLPVLFLPYWSFQLYVFMKVSLSPDIILCGWLGLKHQLTNLNISDSKLIFKYGQWMVWLFCVW